MALTPTRATILGMVTVASCTLASFGAAQEPRLDTRIPEPTRSAINAILDSARTMGLPTEPIVDRALEGAAKGADPDRIFAAVQRLSGELGSAYDALGTGSSAAEIVAGASALRAGARPADLAYLRELRGDEPLTVAASTLADLVAIGVPADTAVSAVIALSLEADDAQYIAFRRNVERDIALGASPVSALGVRLDAFAASDQASGRAAEGSQRPRRPRKP
jgi:hypothetical protein